MASETTGRGHRRADSLRRKAGHLREEAGARFDLLRRSRPSVQWAVDVHSGDQRAAGTLLSGGLAFRLFLWLLPFCLVVVTALGLAASWSSRPPEALAEDAGLSAAIAGTVAQGVTASQKGRVVLLIAGLCALFLASKGMVKAVRAVSILAWRVHARIQGTWKAAALMNLGIVGLILMVMLTRPLYAGRLMSDLFASALSIALLAAGGWLAMWLLPHPHVPWTAMLPGALLFGVGIELLRLATTVYYVRQLASVNDLYGAMGFASVVLAWLYLLGRLIVVSVLVNATGWRSKIQQVNGGDTPGGGGPDHPGR